MVRNILNLGFGVQSSRLYLASCLGEMDRYDCAIAADTGNEPNAVYAYLDWLLGKSKEAGGIPIHVVSAGNLFDDMMNWKRALADKRRRARLPFYIFNPKTGEMGMLTRQCTPTYKAEPIERFIKESILGLGHNDRWPTDVVVRQHFGISADEFRRCAYPVKREKVTEEVGKDLFGNVATEERERVKPVKWKSHVYPLCDREFHNDERQTALGLTPQTRNNCLAWFDAHGFQRPPRSACKVCPFRSDANWQNLKDTSPEEFEEACKFDEDMRDYDNLRGDCYLHNSRMPLRQVDFTDNDYPMFQCSDGLCGV